MADPVVHFELPADDLERAQRFYRDVFGWTTRSAPAMQYVLLGTTPADPRTQRPRDPGTINGGMMKRQGPVRAPVITIAVADIDATCRNVKASGGTVVHPKAEIPKMGWSAYVQDPEGNVVGLFQAAMPPA